LLVKLLQNVKVLLVEGAIKSPTLAVRARRPVELVLLLLSFLFVRA